MKAAKIPPRIERLDQLWHGLQTEIDAVKTDMGDLYAHEKRKYIESLDEAAKALGVAKGALVEAKSRIDRSKNKLATSKGANP